MPTLIITDPAGAAQVFQLDGDVVLFGRADDCGLVINLEGVSRRHGRFFRDHEGRWRVEDLQSKNGILINGRRILQHLLADGDALGVGDAIVTYHADSPIRRCALDVGVTLVDASQTMASMIEHRPNPAATVDTRRLSALYEISKRLLNQRDARGLIDVAASEVASALSAGSVVFGLTCDPEHHPDQLFVRPVAVQRAGVTLSLSVLRRTIDAKRSILIADARSDENLQMAQSIVSGGICSALCVPLMREDDVTGFMYVDSRRGSRPYDEQDLDFASAVGAMVGTAVENARLYEAELVKQRMEAELAGARRVQQAILPATWPVLAGWELYGQHCMCHEVGGDYYDAIVTPDAALWLFAADVSGKGVPAALMASSVHIAVQALVDRCSSPAELLSRLNHLLLRRPVQSAFVTCLVVMIPPASPEVVLASAGHPAPLAVPTSGASAVIPVEPGFVLGIVDDPAYQDTRWTLPQPGTSMLLYTDGVTEALGAQEQWFGEQRLLSTLDACTDRSARGLTEAVVAGVQAFRGDSRQSDDLTLLACRQIQ